MRGRADKYESKLAINGSFEDVIKVMVSPGNPSPAPKPVKPKKEEIMSILRIAGVLLSLLGIAMFCFGASMFTYRGKSLNPFISDLGKYSFLYWFHTLIVGFVLMALSIKQKKT